jgi:outer membrane protein OmpA-like peptidoglycan-associated protein
MCSQRYVKKKSKEEGEKPFWISFSDLMTALMVMFLVVMAVALLAVTSPGDAQQKAIDDWVLKLEHKLNTDFPGVNYQRNKNTIDFGSRANFKFGKSEFEGTLEEAKEKEEALRKFVPALLALANDDLGKKVVKRVVVEGYTDKRGTYLSNLDLSLRRSERVLCILLDEAGSHALTAEGKKQVRELFLVGGYSFNNEKNSDEESRRIEMRIEFLGAFESRKSTPANSVEFGKCPL